MWKVLEIRKFASFKHLYYSIVLFVIIDTNPSCRCRCRGVQALCLGADVCNKACSDLYVSVIPVSDILSSTPFLVLTVTSASLCFQMSTVGRAEAMGRASLYPRSRTFLHRMSR